MSNTVTNAKDIAGKDMLLANHLFFYDLNFYDELLTPRIYGPVHEFSLLIPSMSSEGSGESAHMHRLTRAFAARINKVWM